MPSTIAVRARPRISLRRPDPDLRTLSVDALVFLIAVFGAFDVTLIGQLPYSEILMLLLLPALLATQAKEIFRKEYRTVYLLMGLWLLSQIITDAYRNMPFDNRMKGMAAIVFFAIDLMVISALVRTNLRRIKLFFLGIAISGVLAWFLHPLGGSGSALATAWKMGIGFSVATVLLLISTDRYSRKRKTGIPVVILVCLAAVYLHFGARSGELIFLAAAVLLLPPFSPPQQGKATLHLGRLAKVALLLMAGAATVWLSEEAIHLMVHAGLYSQYEAEKFETQSAGKLGVVFGGRPEGPVAVRAIMDSPILGHGSFASDPKYNVLLQDYQYEWGYTDSDTVPDDSEGIPTHSHLTGAWVEAGFLGSILWFYLLGLICRSVLRLTEIRHPLTPLYLIFFIDFFWDILFSPFGNTRRITEAFFIVLMVNLVKKPPVPRRKAAWRVRQGQPVLRQQLFWRKPLQPGMLPFRGSGRTVRPSLPRRTPT